MRKWLNLLAGTTVAAVLAVSWIASLSAAVNFQSGPTASINSAKQLVVFFDATGLGNAVATLDVGLSADVSGCARCKNKGGNLPSAANKFDTGIQSVETTCAVHNGRTKCTITLTPTAALDCPGNQSPTIIGVQYANIVLSSSAFENQNLGTLSSGTLACTP